MQAGYAFKKCLLFKIRFLQTHLDPHLQSRVKNDLCVTEMNPESP